MTELDQLLFGRLSLKIESFEPQKLVDSIYKTCKVISLYTSNESIYVEIYPQSQRKLFKLLEASECVYEITRKKGICFTIGKYCKRFGLYFGVLFASIIVMILSNVAMKIEINGTEDEDLKNEIIGVLKSNGLYPGAFLPALNFMELDSVLYACSDDIAWASIGHEGSLVTVNIAESTNKQTFLSKRIPSNIIAARDGVIVNAEVLSGRLCVLLGSAVSEGELLVSGIVERTNGRAYYYHSIANIIAEYEQTFEVHQDYVCRVTSYGESVYCKAIRFFDYDISLPSFGKLSGNYSKQSNTVLLRIFGIELPFGITTDKYTEVISEVRAYTTESAFEEAYKRLETIEQSLQTDQQIVNRDIQELTDETGVTLKVTYTLRGDIGKQSEIFAN